MGASGKLRNFLAGQCKTVLGVHIHSFPQENQDICNAAMNMVMRQADKIEDGGLELVTA